ncbi:MAG: Mpv17/PMP22 family protein [Candidatus Riflebacteria bacterium]|nr:Mpv17/PMP22 family protein [Candidatus Riflebacteria bacterium]
MNQTNQNDFQRSLDFIWGASLAAFCCFLLWPPGREAFTGATKTAPFFMGFAKVAILASMGELLAIRLSHGIWKLPYGMLLRAFIWGMFGISFTLVFPVFDKGTNAVVAGGLLPSFGINGFYLQILVAFYTSSLMNMIFAPTFMAIHRITDSMIELRTISSVAAFAAIDWNHFYGFVLLKTIPFFWIPAHTVTFLLPPEYRVLMASLLSIALGAILSSGKRI